MKTIWEELELNVEYEYAPSEEANNDLDSPLLGPGCHSSFDITGITFRGVDILMAFTGDELYEMEERLLIEHEEEFCREYEV